MLVIGMETVEITLQQIWQALKPKPFVPNLNQEQAILHVNGPLYLTAGPGSGKMRVLLPCPILPTANLNSGGMTFWGKHSATRKLFCRVG